MRIWGDTSIKEPLAFTPCPFIQHQETCSRSLDTFAPYRVLTRLKVAEQPSWRMRPAGPSLGKSLSIGLPSAAILTATPLLLAESLRLLPLVSCRTRLLRAWPHALISARPCPPAKRSLRSWVCCVQCCCECVVSCWCPCNPSSFLIRAWDRQWQSWV